MIEGAFSTAFARVRELAEDFRAGEQKYLHSSYSEADARNDFINKFWIALGWDVNHEREKNPYRQEVKIETSVKTGESKSCRTRKADYAFTPRRTDAQRLFLLGKTRKELPARIFLTLIYYLLPNLFFTIILIKNFVQIAEFLSVYGKYTLNAAGLVLPR